MFRDVSCIMAGKKSGFTQEAFLNIKTTHCVVAPIMSGS